MLILIQDAFDKSLNDKLKVFGEVTEDSERRKDADVILIRSKTKCNREYLEGAPNCRLIIRGGVGMDNIDKEYCKERGIIATNTPKSSAPAVAELAFALMLSTASKICFYDSEMKKGSWAKKTKRSELGGKTLALLGLGNIAKQVALRAKAFGMKVQSYDKYVTESDIAELKPSVLEAVKDADYISMHLPFTPETDKIINAEILSKLEKSPVLVNTGRGKCVDEDAVAAALKEGKLSWFCTDVYSSEPPAFDDNPLFGCENVTFTPHVGANSTENLLRIGEEVVETIADLIKEGRI